MSNSVKDFNLDVIVKGELIDLCLPNENFALNSTWYKWFNDPRTTRFLEQGILLNTPEKQLDFYKSLNGGNRTSLIISDKENYVGTISLSDINMYKRRADIAIVLGEKSSSPHADLIPLEAMARLTAYGMDTVGLNRIQAGQHIALIHWQRKLEIIGYKIEGIKENSFVKGTEVNNSMFIAVTRENYNFLKEKRRDLWDGVTAMKDRLNKLPNEAFVTKIKKLFKNEGQDYYNEIFNL